MTTELVNSQPIHRTIKDLLRSDAMKEQFALALPKHLTADRFVRVCLSAMTRTPKLEKCTQASFFSALLTLSQLGLEPDGRRAHLIPYENRKAGTVEAQLIIDYKGFVELVMRSGLVSNLHADKVCEHDEFVYDRGQLITHKIDFRKPRGAPYAYYAICRFRDGTEKAEVMTLDEVIAIRNRSSGWRAFVAKKTPTNPWETDFDEMSKKTVFKRISKWLPMSSDIRAAVEVDNEEEIKLIEASPVVALPAGETKSDQLAAMLDQSIANQADGEESQVDPAADPVAAHDQADRMDLLGDLLRVCTSVEEVNQIRDDYLAGAATDVMKNAIGMACSNRAAEIGSKTAGKKPPKGSLL